MQGLAGSGCEGGRRPDGCTGDALGRLVGRVRAHAGARWARLGWLGREAEQPGLRGLLPHFFFLFSFFFFLDLNSNLTWVF